MIPPTFLLRSAVSFYPNASDSPCSCLCPIPLRFRHSAARALCIFGVLELHAAGPGAFSGGFTEGLRGGSSSEEGGSSVDELSSDLDDNEEAGSHADGALGEGDSDSSGMDSEGEAGSSGSSSSEGDRPRGLLSGRTLKSLVRKVGSHRLRQSGCWAKPAGCWASLSAGPKHLGPCLSCLRASSPYAFCAMLSNVCVTFRSLPELLACLLPICLLCNAEQCVCNIWVPA